MSELEEPNKPDTDELLTLILIQQMRIYDVMMGILLVGDADKANKLFELHKNHDTWGPLPFIQVEE